MKKVLILLSMSVSCSIQAKTCEWNGGQNPYKGSLLFAVLKHEDIPIWPRLLLAVRIGKSAPTDHIRIYKDHIKSESGAHYYPGVFDMNFGNGERCATVRMDHWSIEKYEPAPVWCVRWGSTDWCEVVPTVCNNVSRVFKHKPKTLDSEVYDTQVRHVPEPGTVYLTLGALLGAIFAKRGKKNAEREKRREAPGPR